MSPRQRERPEWITFGASVALLALVVGAIVWTWVDGSAPADPTATVEAVVERDGRHHVEVTVRNDGDDTAAEVQVLASLTIGTEVEEADQVVDFLAGGEEAALVFVFADDPADGTLEVVVSGFAEP